MGSVRATGDSVGCRFCRASVGHARAYGARSPPARGRGAGRARGMKVVIFCGGLGVRMGEATQRIPKPMIAIGTQPILWHIMKWYASWGHTDFILCLGHRAEVVKDYFLKYNEALANDFVLSNGGRDVELLGSDISDWRITFVDTGVQSTIGERLGASALPGRRRILPRDLRRRRHRRAARRHDRDARGEREDGTVHLGQATTGIPPRAVER